ncbi:MAG: hypothetical protein Q8L56_03810 [Rhodocyclaceae bacterium]|nr:hypothetical protein [Rhodocyclaceae bacterium]
MNAPAEKSVYYISARPEAYEFWGEVGHDEALRLASLIAERAARRFRNIEFRVDADWHMHPPGMELVAAYIDDHLPAWMAELAARTRAA